VLRLAPKTRLVLALVCATLVALRIAGAHLHLCFDGSEPPVALHIGESGGHHGEELAGFTHSDRDVNVSGDYLSKKPGATVDLGALCSFLALLLFVISLRTPLPVHRLPRPARRVLTHGLPPPRGPPRPA
jgi:hypothetical protein